MAEVISWLHMTDTVFFFADDSVYVFADGIIFFFTNGSVFVPQRTRKAGVPKMFQYSLKSRNRNCTLTPECIFCSSKLPKRINKYGTAKNEEM